MLDNNVIAKDIEDIGKIENARNVGDIGDTGQEGNVKNAGNIGDVGNKEIDGSNEGRDQEDAKFGNNEKGDTKY